MATKQQELDVIENWEEIDETEEIEKKLETLLPIKKLVQRNNVVGLNGTKIDIILTGDDALRSQYVPPTPMVKILKRPAKDNHNSNDTRSYQPKKTLQQRKQEYAEARLRIMGEGSTGEKVEERICIQSKPKQVINDNVIRLPKGPDGTRGFNMRR